MTRPKAMPPPSPSSSGSESETSTSSSDEEEQQPKDTSPVKKKPVEVPKQEQNMVAQERIASPPAKKKSILKKDKKPPSPVPHSAADASGSEEEASDSPPKAKPTPSFSRPRNLKPSTSTDPTGFSKPEVPTPAAASQQSHRAKEKKRQREEVGDIQEGDAAAVGRSSSKKLFQRVWTAEDEIALLHGMLDFQEKHGGPLGATLSDAAFESISSTLQRDFSKIQLYTKIRGLRKKYEKNLSRGSKDADPSFAKPHEQVAFKLSKKLWPTVERDRKRWRGHQGASPSYPSLTEAITLLGKEDDNSFLAQTASRALESLKSTKLKALEDRWSKHFITGVNYFMERARLKKDLLQSLVGTIDSE